ncbi:hypothetical protein FNL55_03565 [Tardiphaga sp. vice352]|uniref:hypothetical protein n=1 Tax=unclassified Tardiphaga TaxID=2631404 RepID=UPI00116581C9|nr:MULTISPECIES: hypothetical protein [unclassified Tardiphaga]MBC7582244.1 hypothetical protein [Tardiphaga sp.]QDM15130.1 hypothetical protein FNL53_03515 [Tardiphaga sp. vice278]QDM30527.1 hypothetical protein FNL55_03565 [Tardiphaga sp. vice352]
MNAEVAYLEALRADAQRCTAAEDEFRSSIAARLKELEQARAFSYRRFNLINEVSGAVASAESEEITVAVATAVLRARLGWVSDSDARVAVTSGFAPVAQAMFASLAPVESEDELRPDVIAALARFEAWYLETHPAPFWMLFENVMPETPVVDF